MSRQKIYYAGQSVGGIYGVKFLALEDYRFVRAFSTSRVEPSSRSRD